MTTKEPSRLTKALLETADDMRRAGVIDALTHAKVTLRHLGNKADVVTEPISGPENPQAARRRPPQPGGLCPLSQPDGRIRVPTGARRQAAERSRARLAQCHSAQGHRGHFVDAATSQSIRPAAAIRPHEAR